MNYWFSNTLLSRLDNKETGIILVVMQRVHQDDLSGYLLRDSEGWLHFNLPAIAEMPQSIDLGDGRKMRIVITTEVTGEAKGKGPGAWMTPPDGKSLRTFATPHNLRIEGGDFKVFTSPEGAHVGPHVFHMGALGGEVKEQVVGVTSKENLARLVERHAT